MSNLYFHGIKHKLVTVDLNELARQLEDGYRYVYTAHLKRWDAEAGAVVETAVVVVWPREWITE